LNGRTPVGRLQEGIVKVIDETEDDGCIESVRVVRLTVDRPFAEPDVHALANGYDLEYHPDFPRPYFKITKRRTFQLQGVVGSTGLRVTLLPEGNSETVTGLRRAVENRCDP
jgi:hypothetical protein